MTASEDHRSVVRERRRARRAEEARSLRAQSRKLEADGRELLAEYQRVTRIYEKHLIRLNTAMRKHNEAWVDLQAAVTALEAKQARDTSQPVAVEGVDARL
jgi:hypothetical protein